MADRRLTLAWAKLHAAVAGACHACGYSAAEHRALLADLRNEPPADWPEWERLFNDRAAMAAGSREKKAAP